MSIVLMGSTSGSCTLQEQAVAGTSVLTLPVGSGTVVANNVNSAIVHGTAVTPSGTSVDFTGIPSWAKRITVMFSGVSTNNTNSNFLIQLGDSGGIENTGYSSQAQNNNPDTFSSTVSFILGLHGTISTGISGQAFISLLNGTTWVYSSIVFTDRGVTYGAGTKTLSETLDRIRITTVLGTPTFDAGSINILYE
jgi:hypothetical protein